MQKIYCSACSNPTEFSDTKPAFCASCGAPFSSTIIAKITPKIEVQPIIKYQEREERVERQENPRPQSNRLNKLRKSTARQEEYIEDDNYRGFSETFEPPEIELDNLPSRPTIKGKDLALDTSPKEKIVRPKLKKMNKKQVEEDFRNDFNKGGRKSPNEIGWRE